MTPMTRLRHFGPPSTRRTCSFARRGGCSRRFAAEASELEVARATAESDLTHLAQMCLDAVQVSLDIVLAEVEQMEQAGENVPDAAAITADEPDPESEEVAGIEPTPQSRCRSARRRASPASMSCRGGDCRPEGEDRSPWSGQHDGDRAVRRARDPSRVPDDPARRISSTPSRRPRKPSRASTRRARRGSTRRSRPSRPTSR